MGHTLRAWLSRCCHAAVCHESNQISRSREQFASPWESARCLCWTSHVAPHLRCSAQQGTGGRPAGLAGIAGAAGQMHCSGLCLRPGGVGWATPVPSLLKSLLHHVLSTPSHPSYPVSSHLIPSHPMLSHPLFYPVSLHPIPSPLFYSFPCHAMPSHPFCFILSHPIPCFILSHLIPSYSIPSVLSLPMPSPLFYPVPSCLVPMVLSRDIPFHHLLAVSSHSACPILSYPILLPATAVSLSASPSDQSHASLWSQPVPHGHLFLFHPGPVPTGCTSCGAGHANGRSWGGRAEPGHSPLVVTAHTCFHTGTRGCQEDRQQ